MKKLSFLLISALFGSLHAADDQLPSMGMSIEDLEKYTEMEMKINQQRSDHALELKRFNQSSEIQRLQEEYRLAVAEGELKKALQAERYALEAAKNQQTSKLDAEIIRIRAEQDRLTNAQAHELRSLQRKSEFDGAIKLKGMEAVINIAVAALQAYGISKLMNIATSSGFEVFYPGQISERLSSVAGNDEAKVAVQDILEYLKNPKKYEQVGAVPSKGILFTGNPGNGKTLLARAMAGEANCAFIYASGSDFLTKWQGSGTDNVKSLFNTARKAQSVSWSEKFKQNLSDLCKTSPKRPVIIFIDEIDAVAAQRGQMQGQERDSTVNQLLTELDGFKKSDMPIIVIAATNHPEKLDKAVVRPGRIDRTIYIGDPKETDRVGILHVHLKKLQHDGSVGPVVDFIAKQAIGFSGADLASVVQHAGRIAANKGATHVNGKDLQEAFDIKLYGASSIHTGHQRDQLTAAYHEAGHALISALVQPFARKVQRMTIVPRGKSLGVTSIFDREEIVSKSHNDLLNEITVIMGGMVAEKLVFGQNFTGVGSDFDKADALVKVMVNERMISQYEASSIIEQQIQKAHTLLEDNRAILDNLAQALLEKKTLEEADLKQLLPAGTIAEYAQYKKPEFDQLGRNINSIHKSMHLSPEQSDEAYNQWRLLGAEQELHVQQVKQDVAQQITYLQNMIN